MTLQPPRKSASGRKIMYLEFECRAFRRILLRTREAAADPARFDACAIDAFLEIPTIVTPAEATELAVEWVDLAVELGELERLGDADDRAQGFGHYSERVIRRAERLKP